MSSDHTQVTTFGQSVLVYLDRRSFQTQYHSCVRMSIYGNQGIART